ncbi:MULTISPECIES: hypothetical protein [unclassified Sphingomonas]|uniref:hypothetical protein n=1 Tax=unclassified Sphingomonas TaxID=196159 RepID=UPI000835B722|nr:MULTISPECIES: hypothetical protein [unclassified Sphingomonas]
MAVQHIPFSRHALATLALAAIAGCDAKPLPDQLEKYCVSDTGLSKYWLTLNTSERRGAIRYQYMGQDAQYVVNAMQIEGRDVSGRADFQSSSTGETRGNPIVFTYDSAADTLKDGAASASCQNRETNEQG